MNKHKVESIKQFIRNPNMNEAVKEVLLSVFLKGRVEDDVHSKAARFIATEKLEEAWQELERFKDDEVEDDSAVRQVGM